MVHKFIQFEKQTFHFPFLKLLLPVFYFSIFWLLSVLLLLWSLFLYKKREYGFAGKPEC